jgi:hypothetical protein
MSTFKTADSLLIQALNDLNMARPNKRISSAVTILNIPKRNPTTIQPITAHNLVITCNRAAIFYDIEIPDRLT